MRIVVLAGKSPFADLLLSGWLEKHHEHITAIFVEKNYLKNMGPLEIFWAAKGKIGWRYAIYSTVELIYYRIGLKVKKMLGIGKFQDFHRVAQRFHIPIEEVGNFNKRNFRKKYKKLKPDLTLLIHCGSIIKKRLLAIPRLGTLNFHPGLLPHFKGLLPVFRTLLYKEKNCGGTLHQATSKIDAGDIVAQFSFATEFNESLSYHNLRIYSFGRKFIEEIVENIIEAGCVSGWPQPELVGSYFNWPTSEEVEKFRSSGGKLITLKDFFRIWRSL